MVIPQGVIGDCARLLGESRGPIRTASVPVDVDPLEFVRAGVAGYGWAAYFGHDDLEVGALGQTLRRSGAGDDRFDRLTPSMETPLGMPWLIGFAYAAEGPTDGLWEGFPAATAVLPRLAVVGRPGTRPMLHVALPVGVSVSQLMTELGHLEEAGPVRLIGAADRTLRARPGPSDFRRAVAEAVDNIRARALSKVVLARSVDVIADSAPQPFDVVAQLKQAHHRSFVFGWQQGETVFVGATPELLVARDGATVVARPLAGSAPRGDGEEEDAAIGEGLLRSAKDLEEHRFVVEDVADRLRGVAAELTVPAVPSLVRLATVQHLSTEISGRLRGDHSVVDLAALLHPTPAVGGTPRAEAASFIDKLEGFDRGWYAGGIGWTDSTGNGEIAVPLRCALMAPGLSRLYAGAGVVGDSDPDAELAETRLKLAPLLSVLAAG